MQLLQKGTIALTAKDLAWHYLDNLHLFVSQPGYVIRALPNSDTAIRVHTKKALMHAVVLVEGLSMDSSNLQYLVHRLVAKYTPAV